MGLAATKAAPLPLSAHWSADEVAASVAALGEAYVPLAAVLRANGVDGAALPGLQASSLPAMGIHRFEQIRAVMAHVRKLLRPPPYGGAPPYAAFQGSHPRLAQSGLGLLYSRVRASRRDRPAFEYEESDDDDWEAGDESDEAEGEEERRRRAARRVQAHARGGSARRRQRAAERQRRERAARTVQRAERERQARARGSPRAHRRWQERQGGGGHAPAAAPAGASMMLSLVSKARAAAEEAADLLFVLCDPPEPEPEPPSGAPPPPGVAVSRRPPAGARRAGSPERVPRGEAAAEGGAAAGQAEGLARSDSDGEQWPPR